jgi:hypothetical protein
MKRIFENKQLHKEFEEYLEKTFQPFLYDVEKFKNDGDEHLCFISVGPDQHGNPHLMCNYVPKDDKNIHCYGSHGYGVSHEYDWILQTFLNFKSLKRQNKLRRILGEPLLDITILKPKYGIDYSDYINEMLDK